MDDELPNITVIGAGPIGIEAALYARYLGYQVRVIERGSEAAENVKRWQHVSMFTPVSMNVSPLGIAALEAQTDGQLTSLSNRPLSGHDWRKKYLLPLCQTDLLRGCFQFHSAVRSVSRHRWHKNEGVGKADRAGDPFRIVVAALDGDTKSETVLTSDIVLDCSGTFGNPCWCGPGGGPALGEAAIRSAINHADSNRTMSSSEKLQRFGMTYDTPDVAKLLLRDADKPNDVPAKKALVVGSGYSAATTVADLVAANRATPRFDVTWITRPLPDGSPRSLPISRIADDALPMRDEMAARVNDLAQNGSVRWSANSTLCEIEPLERGFLATIETEVSPDQDPERYQEEFDWIIANVGYCADNSASESLQVHRCYASGGPMKLAASLLNQQASDCLEVALPSPEALQTTEPNFYVLGAKSYGCNSQFLFQTGLQQIRDVFTIIGQRAGLDLYATF